MNSLAGYGTVLNNTFEDLLRTAHDGSRFGHEGDALEDAIGA